jgi:hypothetical protein
VHGVDRDAKATRGACKGTGAARGVDLDVGAAHDVAVGSEVSAIGGVG